LFVRLLLIRQPDNTMASTSVRCSKNWLSSQPPHQTVKACFGSGRKTVR
jgi:hypothetical protein